MATKYVDIETVVEDTELYNQDTKAELRCILKVLAPQRFLSDFAVEFRRKDRKRKATNEKQILHGQKDGDNGIRCKKRAVIPISSCESCGPKNFTKCYCAQLLELNGPSYATFPNPPVDRIDTPDIC